MKSCRSLSTAPAPPLPRWVTTAFLSSAVLLVSPAIAQEQPPAAPKAPEAAEPAPPPPAEPAPPAEAAPTLPSPVTAPPADALPPGEAAPSETPAQAGEVLSEDDIAPPPPLKGAPRPDQVPLPPAAESAEPRAAAATAAGAATAVEEVVLETEDELENPNYTPGYRRHMGFGIPPHVPRYGSLPGGMVAPYGVPPMGKEWTFKWTGFMLASLAYSIDQRRRPSSGQSETVFHTPPQTVDEWRAFTSTNAVPGSWVGMKFAYGTDKVTAHVSIDTWNPTRPTTYYQMGSQSFINDSFLTYRPDAIGGLRLRFTVGYYSIDYGAVGQYGGGVYSGSIAGGARGVGESFVAEHDLTEDWVGVIEHGIMGGRTGKAPDDVVAQANNSWQNPALPAWWFHHAHVGLIKKGDPELQIQGHYLSSWSQDDTTSQELDVPGTRDLDESNVPDGRMTTYAVGLLLKDSIYGFLGLGASITKARNATVLRGGMVTYGGDGEQLQDRWLGESTGGTGTLYVFGINHYLSLGKLVAHPIPFPGDGPDLVLNGGFQVATTKTEFEPFDGRVRLKFGLDTLYTFLPWLGVGVRGDHVVPNADDAGETFNVLATRLQFKTDWTSREAVTLNYVKWFYGERTRNEGTGLRTPDRLDDQLIALSYNMWW